MSTRTPAAAAQQRQRVIAYIRVSKEGGRGADLVSPAIQRTSIEDYCAARDYDVVEVLEDVDRTGTLWKRRQIEYAVKRIEGGHADLLVVWKLSRVTRNTRDWYTARDRVERVGGRIESATEPNDQSPMGQFATGMFASMAELDSKLIGQTWKEVHALRAKDGKPHSGPHRMGYSYLKRSGTDQSLADRGTYVVNPAEAPLVLELHQRYAEGAGLGELAIWLFKEGVTGARGTPWTRYGVSHYLRSGFAAGYLSVHDPDHKVPNAEGHLVLCQNYRGSCRSRVLLRGAQEPIISDQLFKAVRKEIDRRGVTPIRSRVAVSKLTGLVYCACCGSSMQLQASSGKPRKAYVCRNRRTRPGGDGCAEPGWVQRAVLEQLVEDWLRNGIAEQLDILAVGEPTERATRSKQDRLARQLNDLDAKMTRVIIDRASAPSGAESAFADALERLAADRAKLQQELDQLPQPGRAGRVQELADGALTLWESGLPHQVNAVLREMLRIEVAKGAVRGERTVRLVPLWEVK